MILDGMCGDTIIRARECDRRGTPVEKTMKSLLDDSEILVGCLAGSWISISEKEGTWPQMSWAVVIICLQWAIPVRCLVVGKNSPRIDG